MRAYYDTRFRRHPMSQLPPATDAVRWLMGMLPEGGAVLDIASGQGRESLWLARRQHPVTAVDYSAVAIGSLRGLARAYSVDGLVTARCSDVRDGLPAGRYAGVLMTLLLHHLTVREASALLAQARGKTHPGGFHAITVHDNQDGFLTRKYPGHCVPAGVAECHALYKDTRWTLASSWTSRLGGGSLYTMVWQRPLR